MALTITKVVKHVVGVQKEWIGDVTFDSSYPTGGEAFAPSDVDPDAPASAVFDFVSIEVNDPTVADYRQVAYDHTNKKLMVFTAINTEATNASNQAAVNVRVLARYAAVTGR